MKFYYQEKWEMYAAALVCAVFVFIFGLDIYTIVINWGAFENISLAVLIIVPLMLILGPILTFYGIMNGIARGAGKSFIALMRENLPFTH